MKIVMYLSGKRGKTLSFHNTQDTIAASFTIPKEHENDFEQSLLERDSIDEGLEIVPWAEKPGDIVPHVSDAEMDDLCSDLFGEDSEIYKEIREYVILCECSCGVIHILKK
jgi:hypothetical protein